MWLNIQSCTFTNDYLAYLHGMVIHILGYKAILNGNARWTSSWW
jgi:hypothetical protein